MPRRVVEPRRAATAGRLTRLEHGDETPPDREIGDRDPELIGIVLGLEVGDALLAGCLGAAFRDQRLLELGLAVRRLDVVVVGEGERAVGREVRIALHGRRLRRAARDERGDHDEPHHR